MPNHNHIIPRDLPLLPLVNRSILLGVLLILAMYPLLVAIWALSSGTEQPQCLTYAYMVLHVVLICWGGTLGTGRIEMTDWRSGFADALALEGAHNSIVGGALIVSLVCAEAVLRPHLLDEAFSGPFVLALANCFAIRHAVRALQEA